MVKLLQMPSTMGEIESELRRRIGKEDYRFIVNLDHKKSMDVIEQLRCESVHPHPPSDYRQM